MKRKMSTKSMVAFLIGGIAIIGGLQIGLKVYEQGQEESNPAYVISQHENNGDYKKGIPVIELSEESLVLHQGDKIDYASYIWRAEDLEDGNLRDKVTWSTIDTSKAGNQTIQYSVADSDGNTAFATIDVAIRES